MVMGFNWLVAAISVLSGFYVFSYSAAVGVYTIIMGIGQIASVAVLLFKQKKQVFMLYV